MSSGPGDPQRGRGVDLGDSRNNGTEQEKLRDVARLGEPHPLHLAPDAAEPNRQRAGIDPIRN